MTRYDITHWADFVRGVADPEDESAMQALLDEASSGASRDEAILRRVATVGHRDSAKEVPASAVRMVKALGSLRREAVSASRSVFKVLFDSLAQPAVAGVRGSQARDRHLVVESGEVIVDVRFEPGEPSRLGGAYGAVVTGQVLHKEDSRPLAEASVMVVSGAKAVGASLTGERGEFQADGLPEGPLDLWIHVGQSQSFDFPLST